MNESVAIFIVLGIWCSMVLFFYGAYRSGRKRSRELALHAPLHPESTVHRMDAAVSQAEEGYNVCTGCGFENFKRSIFCQICGETMDSPLVDLRDKKSSSTGRWSRPPLSPRNTSTTSTSTVRTEALSSTTNTRRQERARKRRQWIRKSDTSTGKFIWIRDSTSGRSATASTTNTTPPLPGEFVNVQFVPMHEQRRPDDPTKKPVAIEADELVLEIKVETPRSSASDPTDTTATDDPSTTPVAGADPETTGEGDDEADAGPIQMSIAERVADLTDDFERHELRFAPVMVADAGLFPVDAAVPVIADSHLDGDVHTFHELFARDFPTKLAEFVKITSRLIIPPEVRHMKLHLDRETLLDDSLKLLSLLQPRDLRVAFRIDLLKEKAVDAGGVYREWFLLLNEGLTAPEQGIFVCVDPTEQTYYLNPHARADLGEAYLLYFLATGRLLGRALLEGNATGFHLALPLLKLILGQPLGFADLEYFDPAVYKNLVWLATHDNVDMLGLDFSVCEQVGDETVVVDLIPNGRNVTVTDANKHEYLERRFRYTLVERVAPQLYVFLKGLYEVIPSEVLMMFDAEELDFVLCGADDIDVDDWERNTKYTSDLHDHPARKWFWEFVREMPNEYRRRLLQFATGSSRVPFSGFGALTSYDGKLCPFTLNGVALKNEGYIHSHACFNRLDLPRHVDREKLRRVVYAILSTELHGFTTS